MPLKVAYKVDQCPCFVMAEDLRCCRGDREGLHAVAVKAEAQVLYMVKQHLAGHPQCSLIAAWGMVQVVVAAH